MAVAISCYLSELLDVYQKRTNKSCTEMALDFDVAPSNLYLYRTGTGNPRANTVDRIVNSVEASCPEAIRETGQWYA